MASRGEICVILIILVVLLIQLCVVVTKNIKEWTEIAVLAKNAIH